MAQLKKWEKEFRGFIYYSYGTSNSKGVAILVPYYLTSKIKVTELKNDNDGRILIIHGSIAGTDLVIGNIYAPTRDHVQTQNMFLKNLRELIHDYSDKNLLIGGDYNICLDSKLDKNGGKQWSAHHTIQI